MQPQPRFAYCRSCQRERRWRFAGWASDGRENSVRPRAFYAECRSCRLVVLTLGGVERGSVTDAEGLCRATLDRWLRFQQKGVRATALGRPNGGHLPNTRVDFEDALAFLQEQVWRMYGKFDPTRRLTFASYASHWLPRRLDEFIRDNAPVAGRRRAQAKLHLTAGQLDESVEGAIYYPEQDRLDASELEVALGRSEGDCRDDRLSDLRGILGIRDRGGAGGAGVRRVSPTE